MPRQVDDHIGFNAHFSVLDETEDWITVSKAAPLIVHPANGRIEPSLLSGLESLLCYELATGAKLSLINRLDRETSGVSLIAKKPAAARQLGIAMQEHKMQKEYLAIVHNHPSWNTYHLNAPIIRQGDVMESRIWVKQCVHAQGRPCSTVFTLLHTFEVNGKPFSLIQCNPLTGRMHQIRVHLSYLGHPIAGDKIYGLHEECYLQFIQTGWTSELERELLLPRHALHASALSFPFDGAIYSSYASLPNDMLDFCPCLR